MSASPERIRLDTPEHLTLAVKRLHNALARLLHAAEMQYGYYGVEHIEELERRMKEARELLAAFGRHQAGPQ